MVKQHLALAHTAALLVTAVIDCSHNTTAGGSMLKPQFFQQQNSTTCTCRGLCLLILGEQAAGLPLKSTTKKAPPTFHEHLKPTHLTITSPKASSCSWAALPSTRTPQSQGRPKLKMNLFSVLAELPSNQASSPHQHANTPL